MSSPLNFFGRLKAGRLLIALMTLSVLDLLGIAIILRYLKVISDPAIDQTNAYIQAAGAVRKPQGNRCRP